MNTTVLFYMGAPRGYIGLFTSPPGIYHVHDIAYGMMRCVGLVKYSSIFYRKLLSREHCFV